MFLRPTGIIRPCSAALTEPWPIVDGGVRRSPALEPTITKTTILDLPRFGGEVRAWDQGIWFDSILSSCFTQFFCSAPGGSHSSVPARAMGAVVARSGASRTTLVAAQRLAAASTTAGWRLQLSDFESGSAKVSSTSLLAGTTANGGSI
jgi:hypothetical protein